MSQFHDYIKRMEGAEYKSAAPGIALMVLGGLALGLSLVILLVLLGAVGYGYYETNGFQKLKSEEFMIFAVGGVWWLLGPCYAAVCGFAGYQLKSMNSYPLALGGIIFSLILSFLAPCLYSYFGCFLGWFLGFPIGIWALVIVMDPMVRERFST